MRFQHLFSFVNQCSTQYSPQISSMAKKKKDPIFPIERFDKSRVHPRKPNKLTRELFQKNRRGLYCLHEHGRQLLKIPELDARSIKNSLAFECPTIEHQIIQLRDILQLKQCDFDNRYRFSKMILDCIGRHHGVVYEGILFGSTTNGLGLRDSDVDLRLRPLEEVVKGIWEPVFYNLETVEKVLCNIAFHTTLCNPADGTFVPSNRCPIAKLKFVDGDFMNCRNVLAALQTAKEGLNYDISLSSEASLSTFNSYVLRFLCHLQPKFHLMATVLRNWSNVHQLIQPGYLSSYALINMLIHFCQTINPPLLPTYDIMRDMYYKHYPYEKILDPTLEKDNNQCLRKAITRTEYNCLLCLREEHYPPSANTEPLSILLLKFFEFYLNFPYSDHIINTRLGRALSGKEHKASNLFHPGFPIKEYINIQDPFDLKHNLTSGMSGSFFKYFMKTIRYSYERLFKELMNNFHRPSFRPDDIKWYLEKDRSQNPTKNVITDPRNWGINSIFVKLTQEEMNRA